MTTLTQANRALAISTPLGTDKLLLASLEGTERISELFRFKLEMWSEDLSLSAKDIVGKNVTITMLTGDGSKRYFHGAVIRFGAGTCRDKVRQYRAEVVPWLWFLTRARDCCIYQNQTAQQIIEAVFKLFGFTDYTTSGISGTHPTLEYVVQYNETAFDFVSRLMEQEGIYYYFTHADGKHTLVLADSNTGFQDASPSKVEHAYSATAQVRVNQITQWQHEYEYRSGKWSQTDYNFIDQPARSTTIPASNLLADMETVLKFDSLSSYEQFEYPGEYEKASDGTAYAKTLMEADEAASHLVVGTSHVHGFGTGCKFTLTKHESDAENNVQYVLRSVRHLARLGAPYPPTKSNENESPDYYNEFTCFPKDVTYRPPRKTPRPRIHGAQTAVVVGPSGEEIWPDKYGRVKVQFHWDRVGKRDENTTCWIRCMQFMAGKNWGSMFIPRIGQEVVVTFLEGNPDRPLITGLVYNADQMPAYTLPDEKTKSYIKTNSSTGGEGHNEIRFDDLAGKEQIFVHAQFNMDQRVLNNSMEHVLNDRHLIVGASGDDGNVGNQYEKVFVNKELHVLGDQTEQIEGNVLWTVGMGDDDDGGNVDILIAKDKKELVEGDNEYHLKGDLKEQIDGAASLTLTGDHKQKISGAVSLDVTKDIARSSGANISEAASKALYLKGGTDVVIEAASTLTLKVGGNCVVIDSSGVSVVGTAINLNSGGSAGSGTAGTLASPDAPTDAAQAAPTDPTEADDSTTGSISCP